MLRSAADCTVQDEHTARREQPNVVGYSRSRSRIDDDVDAAASGKLSDAISDFSTFRSMIWSAPRLRTNLDFSSPLTTPITMRPAIFARSINALPTPPATQNARGFCFQDAASARSSPAGARSMNSFAAGLSVLSFSVEMQSGRKNRLTLIGSTFSDG